MERRSQRREGLEESSPLLGREQAIGSRDERHTPGVEENNWEKAAQLTSKHFNSNVPYEAKAEEPFRFGSFTTAGELYVETGLSEVGMTGYRRSLSLDSAVANVSFVKDGVRYERRYFVSYPANIMAVRFTASEGGKQNLVLSYAKNPVSRAR